MPHLGEILRRRSPVLNLLAPDRTVADAVEVMASRHVGAVLLVERDELLGIFSERDLLRRVIAAGKSLAETPLRDVMTQGPITASPQDDRASAILKMQAVGCRHLPILSEGEIIDMVSIRDLLFDEIRDRERELEEMRRYVQDGR